MTMDKSIQEAAAACRGAQFTLTELADALSEQQTESIRVGSYGFVDALIYHLRTAATSAGIAAENLYKALDR
jgi:hypothetical protein